MDMLGGESHVRRSNSRGNYDLSAESDHYFCKDIVLHPNSAGKHIRA